jgi:hypothetical protein
MGQNGINIWLKRLLRCGSAVALALVLGMGSAWWAIAWNLPSIQNGAWHYDPLVGSVAADPYLRAQVAKVALLALNNSEALYFFAATDDNGNPLRCDRTYRVEGRDFDCRWWSITAYAEDDFLIPNDINRYSYNMTNLERRQDGTYRITLSRSPQPGNWIPTGDGDAFGLALRIYNPVSTVRNHPEAIALPRIIREEPGHE